jgi:hypothetical protein
VAGAPWCRLVVRRNVSPWIAPAALVVAFVLTFLPWIGVAPNGTPVYTQTAWWAARGSFETDPVGEEVMKREEALKTASGWSALLTLYLVLLVLVIPLAVAERVISRQGWTVPDLVRPLWPRRQDILAGLSAALLLLLLLALFLGVGLETAAARAAEQAADEKVPPAAVTGRRPEKLRDLHRDVALGSFALHRSGWVKWAVLAQFVALAGAGLTVWLDRHPERPEPRIECYC